MLIDNVTITVTAGKGGKGSVAFNKTKMMLGPSGGSGGRGGSVYLEAISDLGALRRFRSTKDFEAEDGLYGRPQFLDGNNGKDAVLLVPRGTVVYGTLGSSKPVEMNRIGERLLVAQGGKGGKGNYQYKSATNTSPRQSQPGLPGDKFSLRLELKLIADIGLIGLPNVGKSSFLNAVTNAQSPVADYKFTTLEPYLGSYYGLILADIPGLIEGASTGKGLGIKFLKHIERTGILFHFIDANSVDPVKDYDVIRTELGAHDTLLLKKPEYVFVTKVDAVDDKQVDNILKELKKHIKGKEILPLSIKRPGEMMSAKKLLTKIMVDAGVETR